MSGEVEAVPVARPIIAVPPACRDDWTWVAFYRDGDYLAEFDGRHGDQGWAAVDQARLLRVELLAVVGTGHQVLLVPEGARAVFTRRRTLYALGPRAGEPATTTTILGWERAAPAGAAYLYLTGAGHTFLADDFQLDISG